MSQDLCVLILAAGKGTRMKSEKAKVLHTLGGIPLVAHPVHTAQSLDPRRIVVVIGHQAEEVQTTLDARFGDGQLSYAVQAEQLGTGHAVMCAEEHLKDSAAACLILYGDVPLLSAQTLQDLMQEKQAQDATIAMLSFVVEDPTGYGRILRRSDGDVLQIREHRDCTPEQRKVNECNAGIYLVDTSFLLNSLQNLSTQNDQGEYYLTDIVEMAVKQDKKVVSTVVKDVIEVLGINDRAQLADLEERWCRATIEALMRQGVTFRRPHTTYLEYDVTIEADATIGPNCTFRGQTTIQTGATIGAGSYLHNTTIPPHTNIPPHSKHHD